MRYARSYFLKFDLLRVFWTKWILWHEGFVDRRIFLDSIFGRPYNNCCSSKWCWHFMALSFCGNKIAYLSMYVKLSTVGSGIDFSYVVPLWICSSLNVAIWCYCNIVVKINQWLVATHSHLGSTLNCTRPTTLALVVLLRETTGFAMSNFKSVL